MDESIIQYDHALQWFDGALRTLVLAISAWRMARNSPPSAHSYLAFFVPRGLDGHCPVTLRQRMSWRPGDPTIVAIYEGQSFYFTSYRNCAEFLNSPAIYAPVVGGYDIVELVESGNWRRGDRSYGFHYHDRTYLFCSPETMKEFAANPGRFAELVGSLEVHRRGR